jgi:hypothetical protein
VFGQHFARNLVDASLNGPQKRGKVDGSPDLRKLQVDRCAPVASRAPALPLSIEASDAREARLAQAREPVAAKPVNGRFLARLTLRAKRTK